MTEAALRRGLAALAILAGVVLIGWQFWTTIRAALSAYWPLIAGVMLVLGGSWLVRAPARAPAPSPPAGGGGNVERGASGPGGDVVGFAGIVLSLAYLIGAVVLILYLLFAIWPRPTPANVPPPAAVAPAGTEDPAEAAGAAAAAVPGTAAQQLDARIRAIECNGVQHLTRIIGEDGLLDASCVEVFGRERLLWAEQRMLLIVLLSGALGGLLHGLRSIAWYIGNRSFVRSWAATYVMLPFSGAAVAFVFYVVVRGGFFSPQASFAETSAFGFAAMSSLVGLFSGQAILKLKQVAETLLTQVEQGADHVEPKSSLAAITLQPDHFVAGQSPAKLTITGATFTADHRVRAGSQLLTPESRTAGALIVDVTPLTAATGSYDITIVDTTGTAVTSTAVLEIRAATP